MERKFVCKFCGKKFASENALNQHTQAKHKMKKVKRKMNLKNFIFYLIFFSIAFLLAYSIYFVVTSPLKIGPLGSQHICADFALFINGEQYFFNDSYFLDRNPYINIQPPYYSVLQMHATNVPLEIFFVSIGWKIDDKCLILHTGEKYCNNETHTLKFYVNGERVENISTYIFKNLDKILISYGSEKEEEIENQLNSITDLSWKVCSV